MYPYDESNLELEASHYGGYLSNIMGRSSTRYHF
jgi:hypothetical protein